MDSIYKKQKQTNKTNKQIKNNLIEKKIALYMANL